MPSLKAKTLRELTQEKVLLELGRRLANSIWAFSKKDLTGIDQEGAMKVIA
jgi:hypothetical protein